MRFPTANGEPRKTYIEVSRSWSDDFIEPSADFDLGLFDSYEDEEADAPLLKYQQS